MKYSASTRGFYEESIHQNIPEDAVDVSDADYKYLFDGQSNGQIIVPDASGNPVLKDAPAPTPEHIQKQNNIKARNYLAETDWYVIRKTETGDAIPQEILDKRAAARASIVE